MSRSFDPSLPRVLVVCAEPFNGERGSGITLTNLFAGWEPAKLFTLYWLDIPVDRSMSEYCCELPTLAQQLKRLFKSPSPPRSAGAPPDALASVPGRVAALKRKLTHLYSKLGLTEMLRHLCLTPKAIHQIRHFDPEVIYCVLSNVAAATLALRLHRTIRKPMVVHIYDDWIGVRPRTLCGQLLRLGGRRRFEKAMRLAHTRLAIGPDMAEAYQRRYQCEFTPIQNPVDPAVWDLPSRPKTSTPSKVLFRFTGNLYHPGNVTGLQEFAEAVEAVPGSKSEVFFEIYAPQEMLPVYAPVFSSYPHTSLHPVPTQTPKVVELYRDADALVIALDSHGNQADVLRLSMPTKIPSILMSGRPLLVYAPPEAAVTKFVLRHQVGCSIPAPAPKAQLAEELGRFLANGQLAFTRATLGKKLALDVFAKARVCSQFMQLFKDGRVAAIS